MENYFGESECEHHPIKRDGKNDANAQITAESVGVRILQPRKLKAQNSSNGQTGFSISFSTAGFVISPNS